MPESQNAATGTAASVSQPPSVGTSAGLQPVVSPFYQTPFWSRVLGGLVILVVGGIVGWFIKDFNDSTARIGTLEKEMLETKSELRKFDKIDAIALENILLNFDDHNREVKGGIEVLRGAVSTMQSQINSNATAGNATCSELTQLRQRVELLSSSLSDARERLSKAEALIPKQ